MKTKRVTAVDVAKELGCAVSSIGAAFGYYSGMRMSKAKAERIRKAATRMGFERRPSLRRPTQKPDPSRESEMWLEPCGWVKILGNPFEIGEGRMFVDVRNKFGQELCVPVEELS